MLHRKGSPCEDRLRLYFDENNAMIIKVFNFNKKIFENQRFLTAVLGLFLHLLKRKPE
jgi:hypothetical protein